MISKTPKISKQVVQRISRTGIASSLRRNFNLTKRIESQFLTSGGEELEKNVKASLRISIQIAVEFHYFLKKLPRTIEIKNEEVMYMADTIRSRMDFFYDLIDTFRILEGDYEVEAIWKTFPSMIALKKNHDRVFLRFQGKKCPFALRLKYLLDLQKMEVFFLAETLA